MEHRDLSAESDLTTQHVDNQTCLNCQTSFEGNFCHACGQPVKAFDKPLKHYLGELLGNMFALDSRFWRTFTALFARPGIWIAEYVGGRHIRYMPPFRLYFFVSAVFFLLLGYSGSRQLKDSFERMSVNNLTSESAKVAKAETDKPATPSRSLSIPDTAGNKTERSGININIKTSEDDDQLNKRIGDIMKSPEQYISRFFTYVSWSYFFLMPVLGFYLWLLFRSQRKYYIPHLFFSINQHTMLFVVMTLILLAGMIFTDRETSPEAYLLLVMPVYSIVAARQFYRNRWGSLLVRLTVAFMMYFLTVFLATGFVVYLAFLG